MRVSRIVSSVSDMAKSDDFEKALADMHTGSAIKPILLW